MKRLSYCFFAFLLSLCFDIAYGQSLPTSDAQYFVPEPFPKSPNVASFTKYGDYQVSLFTGVPEISIPLYTIEAGGLKVPISLSYHASGIKVTDAAGWVGLGWTLPGAGAVSRRIIGGPDDDAFGYLRNFKAGRTYNMTVNADMDHIDSLANGSSDARPDMFSFDFPGHSGKFFFDGTNAFKPVVFPYAPIGIKYSYGGAYYIGNFNLTDEQGNSYKFGDSATETTQTSGAGKNGTAVPTSWLMENMISQNRRDTISFSYGSEFFLYPDATSQTQVLTDQLIYHMDAPYPYSVSNVPGPTTGISTGVAQKPLQQISFRNGKVVFELEDTVRADINLGVGNNVHALKNIKVYTYNYNTRVMELQKTIKFYKSYFGTSGANNLRLRLDSVQILDKAGAVIQHYRFGYNTSVSLPQYGSFARDYWGYYNGKTTSNSFIPRMTVPYDGGTVTIGSSVSNNRACDSNYMQAYVLDTIRYPTGGYTTLTYQTNRFSNYLGQTQLAGGLRVTSIKSYDGINANPMVKTYQYNTADSNYYAQNSFFASQPQTHRYFYSSRASNLIGQTCVVHTYVSNPNCDIEPLDAASVVYRDVTEYNGTPSANTGKTDYLYSYIHDDIQDASMGLGAPVVTSYFYARGQLLKKTESLRRADGSYQVVKQDSSSYAAFPEKQYLNIGLVARKNTTNEGSAIPNIPIHADQLGTYQADDEYSYNWAYYWIYSKDNQLTSTTTKIYDINDPAKFTTSTVNYTYGDTTHMQIAKTRHVDSKGNTHVTVNKYPFDYLSGSTTHNAVLDSMISRHMYTSVVEKWDSLKNVTTSVNSITGAQLNTYQPGFITNTTIPATISTLSVSSPITNFTPLTINSGTGALVKDSRYVQMISFDSYDSKNNLVYYTPRNARPTAVLWDYLYEHPVAQVKNAPPLSGVYTYFAYTGFEADGKGSWVYSGTPITDPTAPTGSKVYSLSSGYVNTTSLDNTKSYIVSYWSTNGTPTVQYNGVTNTGTAMTTVGGWTYYEHVLPTLGSSSYVMISGSASIDELRLYPSDAQMTTYAYEPEGLADMSDAKGQVNHFEYDYFARLKNIKDFYGNIVNNYYYHTYDQTIGNDAMSHSYTRNNCPPNTNPGSLTYSVPVNKYYSSTKASANADASFEMATSGQAKANQNCGCPVIMVNVTLTNSTGISGFQATFNGVAPYNFPSTGSTVVQVPQGTYTTVSINPVGSATHTFKLTGYTNQVGHSASWSNVSVTTGSSLTLTVQ